MLQYASGAVIRLHAYRSRTVVVLVLVLCEKNVASFGSFMILISFVSAHSMNFLVVGFGCVPRYLLSHVSLCMLKSPIMTTGLCLMSVFISLLSIAQLSLGLLYMHRYSVSSTCSMI